MRHYFIALIIPTLLFALVSLAGTSTEIAINKAPMVNLGEVFGRL